MDYEELQKYQQSILEQALSQGLRKNEEETVKWTEYKASHEKVIESMQTFLPELNVDCLVPVGKKALIRGKLTHTNEILVCLGDGYFAKYSVSQAIALCNRRIKSAERVLTNLEKERELYEMRKRIPETFDAFGGEDRKDFIEHWDDQKLVDWRAEHRRREKEYRKKLAELKNTEKQDIKTEEDLFAKLDALELQEELEAELDRLEASHPDYYEQDDDEVYEESDESSAEEENEDEENPQEVKGSVSISDRKNVAEDGRIPFAEPEEKSMVKVTSKEASKVDEIVGKKVVFGESQVKYFDNAEKIKSRPKNDEKSLVGEEEWNDDEIVRIEFKHSENECECVESEIEAGITSPRDIYRLLSKPRSILKNNKNKTELPPQSPDRMVEKSPSTDESSEQDSDYDSVGLSAYNAVVHDIKERPVDDATIAKLDSVAPSRPVSKFRRDRLKR